MYLESNGRRLHSSDQGSDIFQFTLQKDYPVCYEKNGFTSKSIKEEEQIEQLEDTATAQVRHYPKSWEHHLSHLRQIVVDIESGQLGEVPIQSQGHEEASILIG